MVDWKSTLVPVIPAEAGIQAVFDLELKSNLDDGGSQSRDLTQGRMRAEVEEGENYDRK